MACFAGISVLRGNVATYTRCGEIFNIHLTTNFTRNLRDSFFLIGSDFRELWPLGRGPTFLARPLIQFSSYATNKPKVMVWLGLGSDVRGRCSRFRWVGRQMS